MTAHLVDTCVVIDYLRDRQEAVGFMRRIEGQPLISVITVAELFAGARDLSEQRRIEAALAQLAIREVDPRLRVWADCSAFVTDEATAWTYQTL